MHPAELNSLGRRFRIAGALDSAEDCYRRSHTLDPDPFTNPYAFTGLAAVIHEADERRADEARVLLEELRDADPDNVHAMTTLGSVYHTLRRHDEAEELFELAAQMSAG